MLKLVDKNLITILRSFFFVIEPKLKLMMIQSRDKRFWGTRIRVHKFRQ